MAPNSDFSPTTGASPDRNGTTLESRGGRIPRVGNLYSDHVQCSVCLKRIIPMQLKVHNNWPPTGIVNYWERLFHKLQILVYPPSSSPARKTCGRVQGRSEEGKKVEYLTKQNNNSTTEGICTCIKTTKEM